MFYGPPGGAAAAGHGHPYGRSPGLGLRRRAVVPATPLLELRLLATLVRFPRASEAPILRHHLRTTLVSGETNVHAGRARTSRGIPRPGYGDHRSNTYNVL